MISSPFSVTVILSVSPIFTVNSVFESSRGYFAGVGVGIGKNGEFGGVVLPPPPHAEMNVPRIKRHSAKIKNFFVMRCKLNLTYTS